MIRMMLPAATAAVVIWLFRHKKISRVFFFVLMTGTLMTGALVFQEIQKGDWEEIQSVRRQGGDQSAGQVELAVDDVQGGKKKITLEIPEKQYASREARAILTEEMQNLDAVILGKNQGFDRVEWNLQLPDTLDNPLVSVSWSTDRPDLVGWDGVLSDGISEGGAQVTLTGILRLSDTEEEYQRVMTVFPSREERAWQERIQRDSEELNRRAIEEGNTDAGEYLLPDVSDGQQLTWYKRTEQKGAYLCLLILLAGAAPFFTGKEKKEKEEQKRRKLLTRQYPELISKLQLLTAAGLSVRKAMERLAKEYPEVACTVAEMHNGVYEQDALAHFGERCGTPEYRKLALLLVQSQKKGGSQLAVMLEKEVQDAFEMRKRKARAEGERSTIRMLFPMFLMLGIVLILIIIPSLMEL